MGASPSRSPIASEASGTASPNSLLIQITSTADPGQDIDVPTATDAFGDEGYATIPPLDVVTIMACNVDTTTDRWMHIQWGGTGVANRISRKLVVGSGPIAIIDRKLIARGSAIKGWADLTSVVNVLFTKWPYMGGDPG
jgi:hypothetical protein